MKRRQFLKLTGGSATLGIGALGFGTVYRDNSNMTDQSREEKRDITIENVDSIDREDVEITIDIEVLRSTVNPEQTARLRITTTNTGASRNLRHGPNRCSLFNRSHGASDPPGLWLHPPGAERWIDRANNRWTRDADPEKPRTFETYGCPPHPYKSGESVSNEYLVWDDYQTPGYMKPETYRFERNVTVYEYEEPSPSCPEQTEHSDFRWGFEIRVHSHE